jgi:hypothetical protein
MTSERPRHLSESERIAMERANAELHTEFDALLKDEKAMEHTLRAWAKAYRKGPKGYRFPSDPDAEFFPFDMDDAADEIKRLRAILMNAPEPIPATCGSSDPAEGLAWRYADWYRKSRAALA